MTVDDLSSHVLQTNEPANDLCRCSAHLQLALTNRNLQVEPGVEMNSTNASGIPAALAAADAAEQVLIFVGIGNGQVRSHFGCARQHSWFFKSFDLKTH